MNLVKLLFSGRMNRRSLIVATTILIVLLALVETMQFMVFSSHNIDSMSQFSFLKNIFLVFLIIATYSIDIRRLHDIGVSGWLVLLGLIPLFNIIFWIYLLVAPGEKIKNKYGQVPPKKLQFFNTV